MTITIEKKHLYALIGIVLVACFIFFGYKSCGKADYKATAKDMKLNTMAATDIATRILSDYQKNWRSAINDEKAVNSDGETEYCSDFNKAITWRYLYFTKGGYIKTLDSLANVIKEDMKIMEDAPSKYEETQKCFLGMYNDINTLISLVNEPKGSLMTFGQKVNELLMDIENKFKETDLKISVSDAEIEEKTSAIYGTIIANRALEEMKIWEQKKKAAEEKKKPGDDFLAEIAKQEGVQKTESGLLYKILTEGKGPTYKDGQSVKITYEGRLIDGTVFDSTEKHGGEPVTFKPTEVIPGFAEALKMMPVGSEWEIYIPQELAYGERGSMGIEPYSALIFKVRILAILNK